MSSHILVIEDDVVDRMSLATILRRAGYRVSTAPNGVNALEMLGTNLPNLILLDMIMPEMDGWEFLAAVETMPSLFVIPVLVLTGLSLPEGQWIRELGVEELIQKPVEPDELLRQVRQHVAA